MIQIRVYGAPVPQGSKDKGINRHTGKAYIKESGVNHKVWREAVKSAALDVMRNLDRDPIPMGVPVDVFMAFYFPRPKSHFLPAGKRGRAKPELKAAAPMWVTRRPDVSKLVRAVEDALTDAGVWYDDSQVVTMYVSKEYHPQPGVWIIVLPRT